MKKGNPSNGQNDQLVHWLVGGWGHSLGPAHGSGNAWDGRPLLKKQKPNSILLEVTQKCFFLWQIITRFLL
jgi:hypothetical protein